MAQYHMTCKVCHSDFDPKNPWHKGGYINVCGDCHQDTTNLTIGLMDAKNKSDYTCHIITDPTAHARAIVSRLGKCGPGHCHTALGLDTSGATTTKENLDKMHKYLYGAEELV